MKMYITYFIEQVIYWSQKVLKVREKILNLPCCLGTSSSVHRVALIHEKHVLCLHF